MRDHGGHAVALTWSLRHVYGMQPGETFWAASDIGWVVDHWWQTETGWPIAANCLGFEPQPVQPGSPTKPVPGYDVRILDDDDGELPAGASGHIALRLPLPPGCLPTLWNDDEGFVRAYLSRFPGHYATGDGGSFDADGYLWVMGRTDDVINVAGHRLSTGAIEEVLSRHPDVAECAVIGVADALKGQVPLGLVVPKRGASLAADVLTAQLVARVRNEIGPAAAFERALVVERLPKTRSGKILRGTMRRMAEAEPWTAPPTVDDPAALTEVADALCQAGFGGSAGTERGAGRREGDRGPDG